MQFPSDFLLAHGSSTTLEEKTILAASHVAGTTANLAEVKGYQGSFIPQSIKSFVQARRKRKRLVRDPLVTGRLFRANQEWAMDFIVDGLANGRMVRILSVVDACTRECLALEADVSLGSGRVTRVLDQLIEQRGRPESLRSDNGPEFCSRQMLGWAEERKIALVHIQPGRPMLNGHVESFHGRLRDECLNAHWFRTLNDVRRTLAIWQREYNHERPHSSLGYRTPEEFRQITGYADVESKERFPHPHSLHGGCGILPKPNLNRESPVMTG